MTTGKNWKTGLLENLIIFSIQIVSYKQFYQNDAIVALLILAISPNKNDEDFNGNLCLNVFKRTHLNEWEKLCVYVCVFTWITYYIW